MDKLKTRIQENIHKMDIEEPNAATWDGLKRKLSQITQDDSLKKHIAENQNQFEIESPNAQSWK